MSELRVIRLDWCDELAEGCAQALGDEHETAIMRDQVQAGQAEGWKFEGASKGYAITRLEVSPRGGCELVIVAGQGSESRAALEWMLSTGKASGATRARLHTERRGMERFMRGYGFRHSETILRAEL